MTTSSPLWQLKSALRLLQLCALTAVFSPVSIAQVGSPVLLSQPGSTRAIAFESATMKPEPFPLTSSVPFSSDTRTRIAIFASNVTLLPGDGVHSFLADAQDASNRVYPLSVEYVGPVPGFEAITMLIVRLSDDLGDVGDVLLRIKLHDTSSNRVRVGIGHIGGGPPDVLPINQPPQLSITASQTSGTAPLNVGFNSTASDPDGYIASYSWSFGDGQTSSQPGPSHVYQSAGTFTASLTVTDNAGSSATASVIITVTAPPPPPPPTNGTSLKVMSFNIEFGEGTDGIYNLDRTASWIANMNPDIVALCQVNRYAYDDQAVSLTTLLEQKTGLTWYFHWKEKYPGDYEGQMILSKYPFVSTSSLYLSYQMSVAQATISVGGRNVNFFSAHLDWNYPSWREVQATELNAWAATFAEPRVIAGDFNAWPDQASISIMNAFNFDAWTEAVNNGTAAAYPDNPVGPGTRTRKGRIDYIFYSRGATAYLEVTGAQIPDSRDLSNPNVVRRVGTLDDLGVRPSEHNIVIATFLVR
jgi:endonuclease/exonuclease/phosphatase family metal-dependent hydrolase